MAEIKNGKKRIKIIWSVSIVLTLICMIGLFQPLQSYIYEGRELIDSNTGAQNVLVYENIALQPGIYDIELEYHTDTSMKNLCMVKDGTVFTGGLLTNGEHLHEYLDTTNFKMWLFEGTEEIQVSIEYSGEGYVETGKLIITRSNAFWSIGLVVIWGFTVLTVGILYLMEYSKRKGIEKEYKITFLVLSVIALTASVPYLQKGNMGGGDLVYHLMRIEGVKDGILSGQIPVRIEPEWLFGHGYANSIFYCNTFLYFPALLRVAGFPINTCYNIYCIMINIVTVFVSYFCFAKIFGKKYIGYICCALYTLSVFRIYKLVFTAAVGEGTAFTFLPLILYGLYRVFTEEISNKKYKTAWLPIAIGYAGLIQSHVLTCEITAFLTILICLVFIKKVLIPQTFFELAKGALAALCLSAWYLVPFLDYYINENVHIKHVAARTIQERGLYIPQLFMNWWKVGNNAMNGELGMKDSHPMGVGAILGIGFLVFLIWWLLGEWKTYHDKRYNLGKVACVLGGGLMFMSLNIFPWDRIQKINSLFATLVSSIQFPNRFLGWATVFLVTIFGCLLWHFERQGQKMYYYFGMICALVGILTSGVYLLDHMCKDKTYFNIYNEEGMGFGYISGAEYLPEETNQERLGFAMPVVSEDVRLIDYNKKYLRVDMDCVNGLPWEGYIDLPVLYYKGYHAYATETKEEMIVEGGDNHVIRVLLPPDFTGKVEVKFVSPFCWRLAEMITYLSYLGFACIGIVKIKRNKNLF